MTRKEAEKKIIDKLFEIKAIYDEFRVKFRVETGVEDDYLTMSLYNDHLSVNNAYWELPKECQIDCWVDKDESGEWKEIFSPYHPDGKKEESK